jgi:hypothetical protein
MCSPALSRLARTSLRILCVRLDASGLPPPLVPLGAAYDEGISFQYPDRWQYNDTQADEVDFTDLDNNFSFSVSVLDNGTGSDGMNPGDVAGFYLKDERNNSTGFQIIEPLHAININDNVGVGAKYRLNDNGTDVKHQVLFIKDPVSNKMFFLLYLANEPSFTNELLTGQHVIDSFRTNTNSTQS